MQAIKYRGLRGIWRDRVALDGAMVERVVYDDAAIDGAEATTMDVDGLLMVDVIDRAIDRLDNLTARIVRLRYRKAWSDERIAKAVRLTPVAVRMRLSRGRAELRRMLA